MRGNCGRSGKSLRGGWRCRSAGGMLATSRSTRESLSASIFLLRSSPSASKLPQIPRPQLQTSAWPTCTKSTEVSCCSFRRLCNGCSSSRLVSFPIVPSSFPPSGVVSRHLIHTASTPANRPPPSVRSAGHRIAEFANKNFLLIGIGLAIAFAKLSPDLGASGGPVMLDRVCKVAVALVFLIQGLSLKLGEIGEALQRWRLNSIIQVYNLAVLPSFIYASTILLAQFAVLPKLMLSGIVALGCLPTTINMCVVLTDAAGGDRALAIFNALVSNVLGIFITPLLLLAFLGETMTMPYLVVLAKLAKTVILPLMVGQLLQHRLPRLSKFQQRHRKAFSRISESALILVVLNTFSDTFKKGFPVSTPELASLFVILPVMYTASVAGILSLVRAIGGQRVTSEQIVAATYTSTQKTLAFGLPLLQTVFQGSPTLGALTTPLLVYHPMQMIAGAIMQPMMKKMIANKTK